MAAAKSPLPNPRRIPPSVILRRALATVGVGTGGATGAIYLYFVRHVPFSPQAGVFDDLVAIIVLIALITVALIVLAVSLDHMARARLRYQAGKQAVATAKSNDEALQTYRALHSSLSWRWLRWLLGLPEEADTGEGGDAGEG